MDLQKQRSVLEGIFVVIVTLVFSLLISMLGAAALKFQIAFAVGLFGLIAICLIPARRTICLFLWVLIQPLGIEKIIYTAAPIWNGLNGKDLSISAGDLILLVLFLILLLQKLNSNKSIFNFDQKSKLFLVLFLWGIVSYFIHVGFYHSEFVSSSPAGIVHLFRNLFFVFVMSAAIQTRKDIVWILIAITISIVFQSILVGLSFSTGEAYNFSRLLGLPAQLQQYAIGADVISRGAGTLGQPNNQAIYHTAFTFLIFGLFAIKKPILKYIALVAIAASFVAIIFTFSRGAWLSMSLGVFIIIAIFVIRNEVKVQAWLVGSFASILFIIVLAILAQPIIDRLTKGDDGATDSRLRMFLLAKDLALQYPMIGVGPDGYAEAGLALYPPGEKETEWVPLGGKAIVPPLGRVELATGGVSGQKIQRIPLPVHNKYLLTVSELGVVGLILWLLILHSFFKEAKACAKSKDIFFRYLGVAGLATTIALSFYMMLDLFADDKTLQIILFPMVVVAAALRLEKSSVVWR